MSGGIRCPRTCASPSMSCDDVRLASLNNGQSMPSCWTLELLQGCDCSGCNYCYENPATRTTTTETTTTEFFEEITTQQATSAEDGYSWYHQDRYAPSQYLNSYGYYNGTSSSSMLWIIVSVAAAFVIATSVIGFFIYRRRQLRLRALQAHVENRERGRAVTIQLEDVAALPYVERVEEEPNSPVYPVAQPVTIINSRAPSRASSFTSLGAIAPQEDSTNSAPGSTEAADTNQSDATTTDTTDVASVSGNTSELPTSARARLDSLGSTSSSSLDDEASSIDEGDITIETSYYTQPLQAVSPRDGTTSDNNLHNIPLYAAAAIIDDEDDNMRLARALSLSMQVEQASARESNEIDVSPRPTNAGGAEEDDEDEDALQLDSDAACSDGSERTANLASSDSEVDVSAPPLVPKDRFVQ